MVTMPDLTVTSKASGVKGEIPHEDVLDDFVADLGVRPVKDAQHIQPAHDPHHTACIVHHRQPLHMAACISLAAAFTLSYGSMVTAGLLNSPAVKPSQLPPPGGRP